MIAAFVRNGIAFGISGISLVALWGTLVSAVSGPIMVGLEALFKETVSVAWFPSVVIEELRAELGETEMNRGKHVAA